MRLVVIVCSVVIVLSSCHKEVPVTTVPPEDNQEDVIHVDTVSDQNNILFDIGVTEYSINIDGVERYFYVQIPEGFDSTQNYPVFVALNGKTNGQGDYDVWINKWTDIVNARHYIGIYPKSKSGEWNVGNIGGNPLEDIGFVAAVVETTIKTGVVNSNNIYGLGASSGGCMIQYLAIHTDYFAAITAVSASLFEGMWSPSGPDISVLHIHGMLDNSVPYQGGRAHDLEFYSAPQSIGIWAEHNGCTATPDTNIAVTDAIIFNYNHCNPNIETILFSVPDATHSVFSSYEAIDLDAYVFDFFERHSL